jgi:sugar lactone lactonase YvrE
MIDVTWQTVASGIISPEGPAVDREGNIFLVSRWTGKVVQVTAIGEVHELVDTGGKPQSIALLASGELLLADAKNHALQRITRTGELSTIANTVDGEPLEEFLGPNDLVIGDDNVVYLTDPGLDMESPGQILRIELNSGAVTRLAHGVAFPNGITISGDGRWLYVAESVTCRVLRLELFDGGRRLGPAEVFIELDGHLPDGIAFDAEGQLLIACCGAGVLDVVAPDGQLVASIPAGGPGCTNCVFGGDDFQTLYMTEDEQQALLKTRWPVPGQRAFSRSL